MFKLASDVAAAEGRDMDQSSFLSPSGLPAVVDCMTVTISSVQLGRYMYTRLAIVKQLSILMYMVHVCISHASAVAVSIICKSFFSECLT